MNTRKNVDRAKAYLGQIRRYDIMIKNKLEMLARLREQAISISAPMGGERVKTSLKPDKLSEAVAKIVDLESIIKGDVDELTKIKDEVVSTIDRLDDADMINLLYKRYVHYERWERIADELGFAVPTVYRLHGKALIKLEKLLD